MQIDDAQGNFRRAAKQSVVADGGEQCGHGVRGPPEEKVMDVIGALPLRAAMESVMTSPPRISRMEKMSEGEDHWVEHSSKAASGIGAGNRDSVSETWVVGNASVASLDWRKEHERQSYFFGKRYTHRLDQKIGMG